MVPWEPTLSGIRKKLGQGMIKRFKKREERDFLNFQKRMCAY
jgi:hypothetical protein